MHPAAPVPGPVIPIVPGGSGLVSTAIQVRRILHPIDEAGQPIHFGTSVGGEDDPRGRLGFRGGVSQAVAQGGQEVPVTTSPHRASTIRRRKRGPPRRAALLALEARPPTLGTGIRNPISASTSSSKDWLCPVLDTTSTASMMCASPHRRARSPYRRPLTTSMVPTLKKSVRH